MFRHHVKINLKLKKDSKHGFEAFNYALHIGYTTRGFQLFDSEFGTWVFHLI